MMRALLYLLPTAHRFAPCEWMLQGTRVIEAHTSMATTLEQPHHARPESMTGHILDLPPTRRLGGRVDAGTPKPSEKL